MATNGDDVLQTDPDTRRGSVLLFSPSFEGHRLIYCRVFTRILLAHGYQVVIAGAVRSVAPDDLLFVDLSRWAGVTVLNTHEPAGAGPELLGTVARLTQDVGAEATLLMEADDLLPALASRAGRAAPWLQGRVVGIFIRSTNYDYQPRLSAWTRARGRVSGRRSERLRAADFHERLLARRRVVDAALVLDERFAAAHAGTHRWLPDVFREFDEPLDSALSETREWNNKLRVFLQSGGERPVVVYTGTSDHRRGYDHLLRLACDENGYFLHCGQRDRDYERANGEVRALRAVLAERGALLETDAPYIRPETADLFLRAARCVVMPYRGHDGSSGVMLQALAIHRPVLVPDRGLMAFRVRSFGLGATYRDGDASDLRRRFRELQQRGHSAYESASRQFTALFSRQQVAAALFAAVSGQGEGARLPQEVLSATTVATNGVQL